MFVSGCRITLCCPAYPEAGLRHTVQQLFEPPFSPITLEGIQAELVFHELPEIGRAHV
jgi:hypothetical protein